MKYSDALLVVDVQNDFCPGGALAVNRGDEIIPVLNRYIAYFRERRLPIFVSRDWHPENSKHFSKNGGQWPMHCVRHTWGAEFHPALILPQNVILLTKGTDPNTDGYTAFQGFDKNGQSFDDILRSLHISRLFIGGLATDYCVKWSVFDAIERGLKTVLLLDAVKGVNLHPADSEETIEEMKRRGAKLVTYETLLKEGGESQL